jgi:DNA-binding HxlR family transcriptional regulator
MAKPKPDVCNPECPSRELFELLAEKWALLVIHCLARGTARTSELRRQIGGVSEKMLIQTLRKLERHGIIDRIDYAETPPRVEYRLSRLGASLAKAVAKLEGWVATSVFDVVKAKQRFDGRSSIGNARVPTTSRARA